VNSQVGIPTRDTVSKDPKVLATQLESSFSSYYSNRVKVLDRKEKDLTALSKRAGARTTNTPALDNNLATAVLESMGI
jgi:hypothetical protein